MPIPTWQSNFYMHNILTVLFNCIRYTENIGVYESNLHKFHLHILILFHLLFSTSIFFILWIIDPRRRKKECRFKWIRMFQNCLQYILYNCKRRLSHGGRLHEPKKAYKIQRAKVVANGIDAFCFEKEKSHKNSCHTYQFTNYVSFSLCCWYASCLLFAIRSIKYSIKLKTGEI